MAGNLIWAELLISTTTHQVFEMVGHTTTVDTTHSIVFNAIGGSNTCYGCEIVEDGNYFCSTVGSGLNLAGYTGALYATTGISSTCTASASSFGSGFGTLTGATATDATEWLGTDQGADTLRKLQGRFTSTLLQEASLKAGGSQLNGCTRDNLNADNQGHCITVDQNLDGITQWSGYISETVLDQEVYGGNPLDITGNSSSVFVSFYDSGTVKEYAGVSSTLLGTIDASLYTTKAVGGVTHSDFAARTAGLTAPSGGAEGLGLCIDIK